MILYNCLSTLLMAWKADCFLMLNDLKSFDTSSHLNIVSELWLDLRGTKLMPSTAQARLQEDLNIEGLVDRFILDESDKDDDDLENIIVTTSDDKLKGSSLDGIIVRMPESGLIEDLLTSINTISSGQWLLVEFETGEEIRQYEGISSLLSLLVGGSTPSFDGSFASSKTETVGGIAWPCASKGGILHAASAIQSLESVESTASGILIRCKKEEGNDDESPIQSAIILPFDQRLWKTAFTYFRQAVE